MIGIIKSFDLFFSMYAPYDANLNKSRKVWYLREILARDYFILVLFDERVYTVCYLCA